ncbi:hypothetical protein ACOSP7_030674 [Xanthoceras sorbifolium]
MEAKTLDEKKPELEKVQENQISDRISSLHDSILHHIFSFLPTKHVVQTCVLSKRWKNLWISLPYLHFDDESITGAMGLEIYQETTKTKFKNLVNNFLLRRHMSSTSVVKFRLLSECAFEGSQINAWISTAVRAGVEDLDVQIRSITDHDSSFIHRLPCCFYTCKSLVTLKLCVRIMIPFPESFCLPNLKSMHVSFVNLEENFYHQLLNCPNLEHLYLNVIEINLDCPPSSSTFQDLTDELLHSGILSGLDDAFIGLICNRHNEGETGCWLNKFIRKLSNVKILRLDYQCIVLLQSETFLLRNLPVFSNLKHLDVEVGNEDGDVAVVVCLLQSSPVLQSLQLRSSYGGLDLWHWEGKIKPEQYPSLCLPAHLKKIVMDGFYGSKNQIELVRLSLKSELLEEIIVKLDANKNPVLLRWVFVEKLAKLLSSKLIIRYETGENKFFEEVFDVK